MLAAKGIVTPNAPRSFMADQYRVIKRPLIANAGRASTAVKHGNLIMVTSALSGEGKSFTSINLAMSIAAELDHTVMLVDADVARPSVLKVLGLRPGRAAGGAGRQGRPGEHAAAHQRRQADLLPSGTPAPQGHRVAGQRRHARLLDDMATRYPDRIVIFDSPPLLLTTESRVLATHMGQIVVVVHAGRTCRPTCSRRCPPSKACPVKMMVLNRNDRSGQRQPRPDSDRCCGSRRCADLHPGRELRAAQRTGTSDR
jgi:protein-tyrosine kinase